nr:probable cytochrome P450 6a23 [Leptinotarsa decemlineata]
MVFFTDNLLLDLFGVLVALSAVLFVYIKRSFQYWDRKGVPYLPPNIPWGNLQPPHSRDIPEGDDVANIYYKAKAKGWKYIGIYVMTGSVFLPVDLELIKHIMTKDFQHFVDRGTYVNEKDEPITAHLFSIGGKKWRNLRTKFTPTFTSGKMRQMFETIANCGHILEKYIEHEVDHHEPLDIKNVLACYTTDIIGSCAFGLDCNSFKEPNSPFTQFGQRVFRTDGIRNLKITFMGAFPNLSKMLRMRLTEKEVEDFYTKVVEDTVRYREKEGVTRPDFLQMLIDIKNKTNEHTGDGTSLTMDEIVAQSFVFFIAGFETSSTTMTFALYQLATHPEIQEKVRSEINSVLEKHNNQITYDALNELKYMGKVIDETLRMYPALPVVTRRCVEDYRIPDSDVIIEKGIEVFIPIKAIHYDPEYYENPEVFDPERFNEENIQGRHPYAHIPFGEGPRICIGLRFGVMQSKVGLVSILKNFRVTLSSKTKLPLKIDVNSVIPTTEGGMWLNLERIGK